jgi:hypothetical protein
LFRIAATFAETSVRSVLCDVIGFPIDDKSPD